jgi:Ca2+-binding RTX toxin-like protein
MAAAAATSSMGMRVGPALGGRGADTIFGAPTQMRFLGIAGGCPFGEGGNDSLYCGRGQDVLNGRAGDDLLKAGVVQGCAGRRRGF